MVYSHKINTKLAKLFGGDLCNCGCGMLKNEMEKCLDSLEINNHETNFYDENGYIPLDVLNKYDIFSPPEFLLGERTESTEYLRKKYRGILGSYIYRKLTDMDNKLLEKQIENNQFITQDYQDKDSNINLEKGKLYRLLLSDDNDCIPVIFLKRTPKNVKLLIRGKEKTFKIQNGGWFNMENIRLDKYNTFYKSNFSNLDYIKASNKIKKAFLRARYNPEYKMCEKIQLRNLKEETGMEL